MRAPINTPDESSRTVDVGLLNFGVGITTLENKNKISNTPKTCKKNRLSENFGELLSVMKDFKYSMFNSQYSILICYDTIITFDCINTFGNNRD